MELESQGSRLVLDLGRPLSALPGEEVPLPQIEGLQTPSPSLLGILISHPHQDHYGLLGQVPGGVPRYLGRASARILDEFSFFTGSADLGKPVRPLEAYRPLELGPFRVTPYPADHSAFESFHFLVESGGRRLFYTGDFRGHGRTSRRFTALLERPPADVHAVLLEGTHIRSGEASCSGHGDGPDEVSLERDFEGAFREARGLALVMFSPQNVDRLVTIYRAARKAGRGLVLDLYSACIAKATGLSTIPQAGWEDVWIYLPRSQRRRLIMADDFRRLEGLGPRRIYAEDLAARKRDLVLTFRHSMTRELEGSGCLEGALAFWSYWPGYLKHGSGAELNRFLEARGIPLCQVHSSGHATLGDLRRLVDALAPARVVPIHTEGSHHCSGLFPRVEPHADGEWWNV